MTLIVNFSGMEQDIDNEKTAFANYSGTWQK